LRHRCSSVYFRCGDLFVTWHHFLIRSTHRWRLARSDAWYRIGNSDCQREHGDSGFDRHNIARGTIHCYSGWKDSSDSGGLCQCWNVYSVVFSIICRHLNRSDNQLLVHQWRHPQQPGRKWIHQIHH